MVHHRHLVPHLAIIKRFITELMRVEEYRVFLVTFQDKLLAFQRKFGEYEANKYIDFEITDIYELLVQYQVPSISSKQLLPSPNIQTSQNNTLHPSFPTIAMASSGNTSFHIEDWYHNSETMEVSSQE